MRKLLQQVSARLEAFVEQRDDVTLVLGAATTDAVPLLGILDGIEANRGSDFFWTFTEPFKGARAYASAVVDAFSAKHSAVRLAMEKEGMKPWPALPASVAADATPPATRLRDLAAFSRELFPVPNGGVAVWTYFPLEVDDPGAFARLMQEVTAHDFPFPWCHHLRFIVRDDPGARAVERALGRAPRVQRYAPDLSTDALNKSLEEEVADESLPLAERMNSLLVSAGNDLAFGRFALSLDKWALLLKYHGSMNNHPMAAIALNGMGQVYQRMGDLESAERAYQSALVPASQGDPPPIAVLRNVVLSLADLRAEQKRWEEAEGYWDAAEQLATAGRDAPGKARALEQRGLCQLQQGKRDEAERSFHAGSVIAAQIEDKELCADLLEHLYGLYSGRGPSARARELREQLTALGRRV
jgi:tetratricopeptide (TPR) repeat protein